MIMEQQYQRFFKVAVASSNICQNVITTKLRTKTNLHEQLEAKRREGLTATTRIRFWKNVGKLIIKIVIKIK
jgi:hypothetical protein